LYYDKIYQALLGKPGVICEFGVQWGSALSLVMNLRAIYEPYNNQRHLFGFDTFTGFPSIDKKDFLHAKPGDYSCSENYGRLLEEIVRLHEENAPLAHIKKTSLVIGDVSNTIHTWLEENPHAVIGMAIFDMDLYKPTKDVLEAIKPRLFKGSLLVFDEFSNESWPGETEAINDVLGINSLHFKSYAHQPTCAWAEYGLK
jgi:hypothetical protein